MKRLRFALFAALWLAGTFWLTVSVATWCEEVTAVAP